MVYELRWHNPVKDCPDREAIGADGVCANEAGALIFFRKIARKVDAGPPIIERENFLLVAPGCWIHARKIS